MGHLLFTDDRGNVNSYTLKNLLAEIEAKTGKKISPVKAEMYPSNDQDYMPHLKLTRDMEIYQSTIPAIVDDTKVAQVDPEHSWRSDSASIVKTVGISSPRSLVVASTSGFMRVWSPAGRLMGEMRLPNVPDTLIYRRGLVGLEVDWSFVQERQSVTQEHKDRARELLEKKRVKTTRRQTFAMRMPAVDTGGGKKNAKELWSSVQANLGKVRKNEGRSDDTSVQLLLCDSLRSSLPLYGLSTSNANSTAIFSNASFARRRPRGLRTPQ